MVQKHKHVRLQEWLEIVYWRQKGFFYTETNPQKRTKNKTKTKKNRWPIYCQGICCLGRFILVFLFTQSLALILNTYPKHAQKQKQNKTKRLVTTPKGTPVHPCSQSHSVFNTPTWTKRCPSTIITYWNLFPQKKKKKKVQRASVSSRGEKRDLNSAYIVTVRCKCGG